MALWKSIWQHIGRAFWIFFIYWYRNSFQKSPLRNYFQIATPWCAHIWHGRHRVLGLCVMDRCSQTRTSATDNFDVGKRYNLWQNSSAEERYSHIRIRGVCFSGLARAPQIVSENALKEGFAILPRPGRYFTGSFQPPWSLWLRGFLLPRGKWLVTL